MSPAIIYHVHPADNQLVPGRAVRSNQLHYRSNGEHFSTRLRPVTHEFVLLAGQGTPYQARKPADLTRFEVG